MSRGVNFLLGSRHTSGGLVVELVLEELLEDVVVVVCVLVDVVPEVVLVLVADDEVVVDKVTVDDDVVEVPEVELLLVVDDEVTVDDDVVVVLLVVVAVVVVSVVLVSVTVVEVVVGSQFGPAETTVADPSTCLAEMSWMWHPPSGYQEKLVQP